MRIRERLDKWWRISKNTGKMSHETKRNISTKEKEKSPSSWLFGQNDDFKRPKCT
jgi:hypothetical protein